MPAKRIALSPGVRFGRLRYVEERATHTHPCGMRERRGQWLCDCGQKVVTGLSRVQSGNTRSCGCLKAELFLKRATTHGLYGTLTHNTWMAMNQRCNDRNQVSYKNYGGRGIEVCKRWEKFENFYKDMGPRPSKKHEIDRRDNDEGYYKTNCHWTLRRPNSQNARSSKRWHILGITYFSSGDASLLLRVSSTTVRAWCDGKMRRGVWSPPKPGCYSYYAYPNSGEKTL